MTQANATVQVYRVYIQATPETIWTAIIDPEWNVQYGYRCPADLDPRVGGAYRCKPNSAMVERGAPEIIIDGEILECDPPRKLVQTWHAMFSPEMADESPTRLTWEIVEGQGGVTTLTVTHEVEGAPMVAEQVSGSLAEAGGGWSYVLSDLKTLLETGKPLSG